MDNRIFKKNLVFFYITGNKIKEIVHGIIL